MFYCINIENGKESIIWLSVNYIRKMITNIISAAEKAQTIDNKILITLAKLKEKLIAISHDSGACILSLDFKERLLLLELLNDEIEHIKKYTKPYYESVVQDRKMNSKCEFRCFRKKTKEEKNNQNQSDDIKAIFELLDTQRKFVENIWNSANKKIYLMEMVITDEEKFKLHSLVESRLRVELLGYNSGPFPEHTKYYAIDDWKEIKIKKQKIYALTTENGKDNGYDKTLNEGFKGKFFFDQSTFDKFYDKKNEKFNERDLSRCLQVAPYKECNKNEGTYRNSILCFDLQEEITVAGAICEANTAYGGGGAHQVYIDNIEELQNGNKIVLNQKESMDLKGTGVNFMVSSREWNDIDNKFILEMLEIEENGYKQSSCKRKPVSCGIVYISGDFFGNKKI